MKKIIILGLMVFLTFGVSFASDLNDNLDSTKLDSGVTSQKLMAARFTDAANDLVDLEQMDMVFTPGDFILNDGTSVAVLSTTSSPGLELDNKIPSIVWADGETTPVSVSFRVPSGYGSGGKFYIFADESDSTTPNQIDFNVYVNADGTIFDSATSDQTPVALAGTAGTPDMVTLTPATDFTSLAAGNVVTLSIWRDDTATGTGDLEVYYVGFSRTK